MRSATSSCKALLRSDLRRYWPVFFCYSLLWIFVLPVGLWNRGRALPGAITPVPLKVIFSNHVYEGIPFTVLIAAAIIDCGIIAVAFVSFLKK